MSKRIKIGIIGCGKQARKHISGLQLIPGIEIILADKDKKLAQELSQTKNLSWVEDVDDIFLDKSINAVDICTPTSSHIMLIKAAVESGKDILCEKPLSENLEEVREVSTLVKNAKRIGMVGYIYRFAPVFEKGAYFFKQTPATGGSIVLGKVSVAHFRLGGKGSHQLWKHKKKQGGGAINEMLVHMIDLAIWYFGPIQEAQVLACELFQPHRNIQGTTYEVDAEDYVLVRLKTKSGVEVYCQADLITPAFTQFIEVQGENGTFVASIQPSMPSYLFLKNEAAGYTKGRTDFNFGNLNLFQAQMTDFVQAIQAGGQPSRSTIQDGVSLMEAMAKIKQNIPARFTIK